jgi:antitoxin component YwqK of YwqJK toxin-antitoxin module
MSITPNYLRNHFIKLSSDGITNGKWLNGKPSFDISKKDGKLNGKLIMYDEDGKKVVSFSYKDSILSGESIIWYKNGEVYSKSDFINGNLEGKSSEYLLHGQKNSETNYRDGKFDGIRRVWDDFGNLISEVNYKKGKLRDTAIFWYRIDTSKINARMESIFYGDISKDSFLVWNKKKQVERIVIHDSLGKLLHSLSYFRNGNLESETVFEPNKNYYIKHEYHFNGITKQYQIYWIGSYTESGFEDIRYLYEETCFGDDGKKTRKRFFDKEGKKVIKAVDLENGKETIVFEK